VIDLPSLTGQRGVFTSCPKRLSPLDGRAAILHSAGSR